MDGLCWVHVEQGDMNRGLTEMVLAFLFRLGLLVSKTEMFASFWYPAVPATAFISPMLEILELRRLQPHPAPPEK